MTPFFSIVIPLYNKAEYIEATLSSVLSQSFSNYEIIIVDDGSTDDSLTIANTIVDARITIFSIKNQGVSAARNFGIKKAKSKYIALLDADDYWYPFHLEAHKKLMDSYPNQFVFSTAQEYFKYGSCFKNNYSVAFTNNKKHGIVDFFKSSTLNSIIHSSSVTINTAVFDTVGLFSTDLKSGEDVDLWIRIGLKYKVVFSTKITSKYRYTPDGLFSTTKNINEKINLAPYEIFETKNSGLKKYLDLNRYALAVQSKLWDDKESFNSFKAKIDFKNLNNKQRFILKLPKFFLKLLINIKNYLLKSGIVLSTYN